MRISDWSSDVCSSDLLPEAEAAAVLGVARPTYRLAVQRALPHGEDGQPDTQGWRMLGEATRHARSEEHTTELQSLMRISYAVFCLNKKKQGRRPHLKQKTPRTTKHTNKNHTTTRQ